MRLIISLSEWDLSDAIQLHLGTAIVQKYQNNENLSLLSLYPCAPPITPKKEMAFLFPEVHNGPLFHNELPLQI